MRLGITTAMNALLPAGIVSAGAAADQLPVAAIRIPAGLHWPRPGLRTARLQGRAGSAEPPRPVDPFQGATFVPGIP